MYRDEEEERSGGLAETKAIAKRFREALAKSIDCDPDETGKETRLAGPISTALCCKFKIPPSAFAKRTNTTDLDASRLVKETDSPVQQGRILVGQRQCLQLSSPLDC